MSGTMKKVLAGFVLFASGLVVGFFGARLWHERGTLALLHGDPQRFAEMVVQHLTVDLELTADQRAKLRPIVLGTAKKLAAIRKAQEPKIQEAMDADIKAIKKLLTPLQREKYELILKRLKERREAMERFGPPPPPPPGMGPPPPGLGDRPPDMGLPPGPPPDMGLGGPPPYAPPGGEHFGPPPPAGGPPPSPNPKGKTAKPEHDVTI